MARFVAMDVLRCSNPKDLQRQGCCLTILLPATGCWLSLLVGLCFNVCQIKERARRARAGDTAERGVVTDVGIPIGRRNCVAKGICSRA